MIKISKSNHNMQFVEHYYTYSSIIRHQTCTILLEEWCHDNYEIWIWHATGVPELCVSILGITSCEMMLCVYCQLAEIRQCLVHCSHFHLTYHATNRKQCSYITIWKGNRSIMYHLCKSDNLQISKHFNWRFIKLQKSHICMYIISRIYCLLRYFYIVISPLRFVSCSSMSTHIDSFCPQ